MQLRDPRRHMPKMYQRQVESYKPFDHGQPVQNRKNSLWDNDRSSVLAKKPKMLIVGVVFAVLAGLLLWDFNGESNQKNTSIDLAIRSGSLFGNALAEFTLKARDPVFVNLELGLMSGNLNLDDLVGGNYSLKGVRFSTVSKSSLYMSKQSDTSFKKVLALIDGIEASAHHVFARVTVYRTFWDWVSDLNPQYLVYAKGVDK